MPTSPLVRQAVYCPVADDCVRPGLQSLTESGWLLHRVAGAAALQRLLRENRDARLAGLLDLRGHPPPHALAALPELMRDERVGWIAFVNADQLADPVIRQLVRDYCFDYLTLPCPDSMITTVVGHAYGMSALLQPADMKPVSSRDDDGMIGQCAPIQTLRRVLRKAALSEAPVFIDGESGTGKELAAQAIHRHSSRHTQPFVAINCGAIAQNLVQSELFGYERGAFTGAQQRKIGRIEHAHGGTLFLDEIGDLPLDCQASLLRFLQEGCFERVGGHESIRVDVRIISATHRDLQAAIEAHTFRIDLYHRLCVLRLRQPPLRERGEDIQRLAEHALARYANESKRRIRGFSACAVQAIHRYAWPGNVRELINRVRQAVVMAEGRMISAEDLHLSERDAAVALPTLEQARSIAEADVIRRALRSNGHRLMDTARDLGVSRVTLYRLMERHGLRDAADATQRDDKTEVA